jgi:hypothetical protein
MNADFLISIAFFALMLILSPLPTSNSPQVSSNSLK